MKRFIFPTIVIFIGLCVIGTLIYLNVKNKPGQLAQNTIIHAAYTPPRNCASQLSVEISLDKQNWGTVVTFPRNFQKYYLRVRDAQGYCSTAFTVQATICPVGKVDCGVKFSGDGSMWGYADSWGSPFISGRDGIARIDLTTTTADQKWQSGENTYSVQLKPYILASNPTVGWSNTVSTIITDSAPHPNPQIIDFADYMPTTPGAQFFYQGTNNITGLTGNMQLQLELPRTWCGQAVIPWRFTKDIPSMYWQPNYQLNPQTQTEDWGFNWGYGGKENLRWMVANDPSSQYFYVRGHRMYAGYNVGPEQFGINFRDININNQTNITWYGTRSATQPPYNINKKLFTIPYSLFDAQHVTLGDSYSLNQNLCPGPITSDPSTDLYWQIRTDFTNISIPNVPTDAKILRQDYWERPKLNSSGNMYNWLRESYYFAKEIGLVRIAVKNFNRVGDVINDANKFKTYCVQDPDCSIEEMENPNVVLTLTKYFTNQAPQLTVSTPQTTNSTNVTVYKNQGYTVNVSSPANYSGYLEMEYTSYNPNGTSFSSVDKWLWIQNGAATVPANSFNSITNGTIIDARYRIWIPNESFGNEVITQGNTNTFGNSVRYTILDSFIPTPVPTNPPPPTSTPTPIPNPIGNLDVLNCTTISGWSCDPNYANISAQITLLANNLPIATTNANLTRSDLSAVCNTTINHGYSFNTPASWKDGVTRTITLQSNINGYVKGIGSGQLNCPAPTLAPSSTPIPTPTPSPTNTPVPTPTPSHTPQPSATQAPPTHTLAPNPTINPTYDANGNGVVDINDVVFIITKYLTSANSSDVNKDGVSNIWDVVTTLKIIGR